MKVSSGATATVTIGSVWTAASSTSNQGAVNISDAGFNLDLTNVTTSGGATYYGYNVTNTGAAAVLKGSALADTFNMNINADSVTGGNGNDLFVFSNSSGLATILDFTSSRDQLQFKVATFGGTAGSVAVQGTTFTTTTIGPNAATGFGHVGFTENTSTGALYYQSSASGPATQVAIIGDSTHHTMAAGDIHFIA